MAPFIGGVWEPAHPLSQINLNFKLGCDFQKKKLRQNVHRHKMQVCYFSYLNVNELQQLGCTAAYDRFII